MYFDSFQAFFHMGGHGFYVWLSYAIFVAVIGWNLMRLSIDRRFTVRRIRQALDMEQSRTEPGDGELDS